MDVILTAGGMPTETDPLYAFTKGLPKAMLPIEGKPMIQWILDCLSQAKGIDQVVLVGLEEKYAVHYARKLSRLADQGDMVANMTSAAKYLLENNASNTQAIILASDVPAITPAMVEWMVEQLEGSTSDITYTVVTQSVMEQRYPESKRSYLKLRDVTVCGGDMNAINIHTINYDNPIWRELVEQRKNALKQAALIGFDTLFLLLIRAITLKQLEARVCKRLRIKGKLIVSPFAETGMDVDKPFQYQIIESDFKVNNRLQF